VPSSAHDATFLVQPDLAPGSEARAALVYEEAAAPSQVAGEVLLVWSLATRRPLDRGFVYTIVPDGCVDLVFDLRGAGAWLYGASPARMKAELAGSIDLVGVRLRPGRVGRALGVSGESLAGRVFDLEDAIGAAARSWADELAAARSAHARASAIARRLASLARGRGDRVGEAIADAVCETGGTVGADELARRFSLSARHVTRLCRRAVGLSPKQLGRVARFHSALRALASAPTRRLAELAAAHGYFDQAHMSGEFRALLGSTPAAAARAASGISKTASRAAR
jgi:AraC-like DNA-binding protein